MTVSNRSQIQRALKLLSKAESTDSNEEAMALAARAYGLVADWLNACEADGATPRRRERRLLRDRRGFRWGWPPGGSVLGRPPGGGANGYTAASDGEDPPQIIDVRA